jgi:CheY-like chemotaxis protein
LPIQNGKEDRLHFSITRVPLLNAKKQVTGLVVILKDIASLITPQYALSEPAATYRYDSFTKPLRVLVVEDNVIAQQVEQALLEGLNCQVDVAKSGDAATQLFQPGKYDIVFMDIGLEDTTGYVVSKSLRDIEKNTGLKVPIIALTSYEADIVKYDCDDYFMDGVITKPMSCEQAMQIIKHFVYHEDVAIDGLGLVN